MINEKEYLKILEAKKTLCDFCKRKGKACDDCLLTYFERDAIAESKKAERNDYEKPQKNL